MNSMRGLAALLLLVIPAAAGGAELAVEVRDAAGRPVDAAVAYAVPQGRSVLPPTREAVLDQKNRMFVPRVLPVQTGTAVRFPNSDNIRHQVYSFSPAKQFQIPLYEGTPAQPVVFDTPGVLTLGCNIHDRMQAYIVVVDTPYFGNTVDGRVELADLPAGRYAVHVWQAGARQLPAPQTVTVTGSERRELTFTSPSG